MHTNQYGGRSQGTQTTNHAYSGNVQILKNNIDTQGYQCVAEGRFAVGGEWNVNFFIAMLSGGGGGQRIEALFEPTEIQPGKGGADEDAEAPAPVVQGGDGDGDQRAEDESEERDPGFGLMVERSGDGSVGHELGRL